MQTNQTTGAPAAGAASTTGYYGESQYGERLVYTQSQWRDPIWAVVWIVHMLAMGYALFAVWNGDSVDTTEASDAFLVIVVVAGCGVGFGVVWMFVLRQCAGAIIKVMLFINLALMALATIAMFASGALVYAIILAIFTVIFALYMRSVWDFIPFTACLIDIACKIMTTYSGTIWISVLALVLQVIWVLWWSAVAAGYSSSSSANAVIVFILLVSFYWSLQVFQNVSHMTTCGVAGAWFFSPGTNGSLTGAALKRTCTTSFGSVCLGSLLVAIIQAMRAMVRAARNSGEGGMGGQIMLCVVDCLLGCLDRLVQFFNKYAYVQCALYGTSFRDSASRTWELMMSRGIEAWINCHLTGFALLCGALVGGLACGCIAYLMSAYGSDELSDPEYIRYVMGLVGFLVGYFLVHTVLQTIDSGVATLFVCIAEDQDAMARNRPEDYNALFRVAPAMQPV